MKVCSILIFLLCASCLEKPVKKEFHKSNIYYDKAFYFLDKKERDRAFYYFNLSKDNFLKNKDTIGIAKCIINMAIIQENGGDDYGSQEMSLSALKYLKTSNKNDLYYLAINYNNLGIINGKLKNYDKSIEFFQKAIYYTDDQINKIIYRNNLANVYRKTTRYNDASMIYNELMRENISEKEYSRILTNLAKTKFLQNQNYNPIPEFQKALKIRLKEKDNWGLNSSFAHLADYYTKVQPDSALSYAKKMYDVSKVIESPDDQIEALQKLISLESPQNSKRYFTVYLKLNDSLQTARNKAKNQFALIRYETEKNKSDFLKAKAESAERKNHIIQQYIIIAIIILLLISSTYIFKRRQKILQQEKLLEVKNTELKYSKKVHDVVANGLYHTMIEIQNQSELDKEKILNRIEKMYEESRDIAQDEIIEKDFYSRFYKMINSYSSDHQRILPVGYKEDIWESLSDNVQSELYYSIREILVNMKKHSQAKWASLKFEKNKYNLTIRYTDNGIGISHLGNKRGSGLRNTENRIDSINGDIIFEKNPRGGLIIQITVPIHSKYV